MTVKVLVSSFVKETTTTTGTGSYTLAGAVTGFDSFYDGMNAADGYSGNPVGGYTVYTCTDGTNYETGIGCLSASTTLQRTCVYRSSNSDSAVNWAAGTKNIYISELGDLQGTQQRLLTKTTAPSTSNDINSGIAPFSLWLNATDNSLFICIDSTASAAKWNRVLLADSSNTTAVSSFGNVLAGQNNNATALNAAAGGVYAKTVRKGSIAVGSNATSLNTAGSMQAELVVLGAQTTSATPLIMQPDTATTDSLTIPINSCVGLDGLVVAYNSALTLASVWSVSALARRGASGDPTIVGSPAVTMLYQDSSASTWAVAVAQDTANHALKITVTGAASTTINWAANLRIAHVGF